MHFSTPHELRPSQLSTDIRHVLNRYFPERTNTYTAQSKCRNLSSLSGLPGTTFWEVIVTKWEYNKKFEDENEIIFSEFVDLTVMLLQVHVSLDVTQCHWINSSIKRRPYDFQYVRNFSPNDMCHTPEDLNFLQEINY